MSTLFESCSKKPRQLLQNFQDTLAKTENVQRNNIQRQAYITIGKQTYSISGLDITAIYRLIRSRWFYIQNEILYGSNILVGDVILSRGFINNAFIAIINSLSVLGSHFYTERHQEIFLKLLDSFSESIFQCAKLNEYILLKMRTARQENCPFYQYFHLLLEVYYYLMILYFICGSCLKSIEKHLENIITNLLPLFKVNTKLDMCQCVDYFWLLIQLISEKINVPDHLFWRVFNKVLEKEDPLISLRLLKEVSRTQKFNSNFEDVGSKCERIKPNYYILEMKFKELLNKADSDSVIVGVRLIEPLICDLWLREGKIDILQIIWEFYSKRLNVSNQNCCNNSAVAIIETIDMVLLCPNDCKEDFEVFVGLLLFHLRKYPLHWGKMKGRIYSQLGPNKVKDLTDTGIRHVMILFLALGSIHFEEIEKKMMSFLNSLPKQKKNSSLVWNMFAAVVLKYVREGHSIRHIAPPIQHMLEEASVNQQFDLIRGFINNLETIVHHSTSMQLNQWQLFGSWLGRYQSVCYFADLTLSLNVINSLLEKCSNADSRSLWEDVFNEFYFNLKQLSTKSESLAIIGKIAGKLALCYNKLTDDAFSFFNSGSISLVIAWAFLEVILDNYPDNILLNSRQENVIFQSWVNMCFLTTNSQSELTRNIVKLDIVPPLLKNILKISSDPMECFIEYLGKNSKDLSIQIDSYIFKLCDLTFGNLDKILGQYLLKPESEKIVLKIYKYTSIAFSKCGNLMYHRNKQMSILTKLVEAVLLPMDFLVGKRTLHNFIFKALKETWQVFFDAFLKLNTSKDPYLERTLKNMVVQFLPYFSTTNSPIVNCLQFPKMAEVILEKICQSFFKPPGYQSDANLLKALEIVSHLATSTTSIPLFKLIIDKTLCGLFEIVVSFHSQRNVAIGAIKQVTSSPLYPHAKSEFKQKVLAIARENMALNTQNCFQLLICLAKFVPEDIRDIFGGVEAHVKNAERMRGVGFDLNLRSQLDILQSSLQSNCQGINVAKIGND